MIVSEEFIKKYASNDSYSFSISTTKYKPTGGEIYRYALATTDNSLEQTAYILDGEPERDVVRTIDCEAYRGISLLVSLIEELSNVFLIAGLIRRASAAQLYIRVDFGEKQGNRNSARGRRERLGRFQDILLRSVHFRVYLLRSLNDRLGVAVQRYKQQHITYNGRPHGRTA